MSIIWTIHPVTELSTLQTEWDSLNSRTARLPMLDLDFWSIIQRHFGNGDELACLCRDGDEVVAGTIIRPIGKGRWETFAPGQAPLGAWLCTDAQPVDRLLKTLSEVLPGPAISVGLTRLDPPFCARPEAGGNLSTLDYILTGQIVCQDGFEAFWQRRGKNLRHNMNRQRNRLGRDEVQTSLRTIRDKDSIRASIDAYGHLESAGWKGESGSALHPDNTQGRFYRELFEFYSSKNEAVVYEYYYNADLVAVDLCLRRGNALTILKTTHDERQKGTSPALLMRQESVRDMLDCDGITHIDFYGKKMDWHTKWTENFRVMYHVNYDRFSLLARLRRKPKQEEGN